MKLSYNDIELIQQSLEVSAETIRDINKIDRKQLALYFKDIVNHFNWTKEDKSVDVPLESDILEKIVELQNLKIEVDKKLELERKVYANAMKPFVMFFIDLAKLILSTSAVCAICYTIANVVPKEWAIWMPIPIVALLGVVYLVQMYYDSWHHGHWK